MQKKLKYIKYLSSYSARLIRYPFMSTEKVFGDIYNRRIWDNLGSVSGDSSTPESTQILRDELSGILKRYEIGSVLDIPCGDFNWMRMVDMNGINYIGADIVDELIDKDRKDYRGIEFKKLDICSDPLPKCDLIFCRDCLVHLSNKKILQAIENIKRSGSKYLMATTFPMRKRNRDVITGAWRALNFCRPPFDFPEPMETVNEGFRLRGEKYSDKSMGLWEIKEIQSEGPKV